MNNTGSSPLCITNYELVRTTAIALLVAVALLVTVILPAEYGVDPFGVGRVLGLDKLSIASTNAAELAPEDQALFAAVLSKASTGLRTDTLTVVVPEYEGIELKATMLAGQSLAFDWHTDGSVLYTDMHGEPHNAAPEVFTTYWKDLQQRNGKGTLIAEFDGNHGWYWQNMTEEPVTVNITVAGFYQNIHEKK